VLALAALAGCGLPGPIERAAERVEAAARRAETAADRAEAAATRAERAADATARRRCEVESLVVDAQAGWVDTGVDVEASDGVEVNQIGGGWTVDRRLYPLVDGNGHLDESRLPLWEWRHLKALATAPFGALLGAIGDRSAPFLVGRSLHMVAPGSGRLLLRINDKDEALPDNGGALVVRATLRNRAACSGQLSTAVPGDR
jgi:predicted small lipoprotein YifL